MKKYPNSIVEMLEDDTKTLYGYHPSEVRPNSLKYVVCKCLKCEEIYNMRMIHISMTHKCKKIVNGKAYCNKCSAYKDIADFYTSKSKKSGLCTFCKDCLKNNSVLIQKRRARNNTVLSKHKRNLYRKKLLELAKYDVVFLIKKHLQSKKSKCKKLNIFFDLSIEQMTILWNKQKGKCFYSHLPMRHERQTDGKIIKWFCPSLDRIDPKIGYTPDNVVWCCFGVNCLKYNLTHLHFIEKLRQIEYFMKVEKEKISDSSTEYII